MALIKKTQADSTTRSAIVLDLGDLRREAERIQAEAERQARAMIEAGRRKAAQLTQGAEERGYETGQKRGYEDGYAAGVEQGAQQARAEASEQFADLARGWEEALAQFERARGDMLADAREDVLRLALRLAERIVHAAVKFTPDCAAQQAAKAVDQIAEASRLRLLVHPGDEPLVRELLPALRQRAHDGAVLVLEASEQVPRGGCALHHGQGVIDATVEKQLARIMEQLFPGAEAGEPGAAREPSNGEQAGTDEQ